MDIIRIVVFFTAFIFAFGFILVIKMFQVPSKVKKAEDLFEIGDFTQSSEIVKKILDKKKDFVPAKYLRARLLREQNQYILSISEFNNILQIPDFTRYVEELKIHYHLAELYELTKQWQKQIDAYKIILSYNPDDVTANHRVGLTYYKQGRYREAKETLLRALNINPALTDVYLPAGISSFNMSDYDSAEEYLLKCLDRKDGGSEAAFYLGQIYQGKKDYESAVRMYERSQKDKKYYIKSLKKIGEIHHNLDNYDEAIKVLEGGLKSLKARAEESIEYRYLLAECYELNNQVPEAIHHWEKIEQESPNYKNTQIKLDDYKNLMKDDNMKKLFTESLEELQPVLTEIIAQLNYNIMSKTILNKSQVYYKAFNTKRINEPPVIVFFNRATREISESQIHKFAQMMSDENSKKGIYITTSRFSIKAKSAPGSKQIELYDKEFLGKMLAKIYGRANKKGR